jgi:hypothetical protein
VQKVVLTVATAIKLPISYKTDALRHYLECVDDVWNTNTSRTENPMSPHHGVDDVWVRWATQPITDITKPFDIDWYPVAQELPGLIDIVNDLADIVLATRIGGVLITRVQPGKCVRAHNDARLDPVKPVVPWNVRSTSKYCIQIAGGQHQAFVTPTESIFTEDGDVFWFNNSEIHWVYNAGWTPRISLIVSLETPRGITVP